MPTQSWFTGLRQKKVNPFGPGHFDQFSLRKRRKTSSTRVNTWQSGKHFLKCHFFSRLFSARKILPGIGSLEKPKVISGCYRIYSGQASNINFFDWLKWNNPRKRSKVLILDPRAIFLRSSFWTKPDFLLCSKHVQCSKIVGTVERGTNIKRVETENTAFG